MCQELGFYFWIWAEAAFFSEWKLAHTRENMLSSISKVMNFSRNDPETESLVQVGLLQLPSNGLDAEWSEVTAQLDACLKYLALAQYHQSIH